MVQEKQPQCSPESGPIPQGCRTDTLIRIAETMVQNGCDAETIFAALIRTNQRRCRPPLDYERLRDISISVRQSLARREGWMLLDGDFPDQIAQAMLDLGGISIRHYDDRWIILKNSRYEPVDFDEIRYRICQFGSKCKVRKRLGGQWDYEKLRLTPYDVGQIAEFLTAIEPARIDLDNVPPIWLKSPETRPNPEDVIAVKDALIDVSGDTPVRLDSTDDFFTLTYLPVRYDPQAECPVWLEKLSQWFQGNPLEDDHILPPDQVSISILQEWFGLALTRKTRYPRILGLAGPTQSGKSLIARILRALIGAENTMSLMLWQLTGKQGLRNISRKHAALVHGTNLSKTTRAVDWLVNFTRQEYWQPNPSEQRDIKMDAKILLIADALSNLFDPAGQLDEQIIRLRTTQSFCGGRQDVHLEQKLLAELPGILNWAIEGFIRLRNRGYFQDSPAEQEYREIAELSDEDVGVFVHQCCQLTPDAQLPCQSLYAGYKRWASRSGSPAIGRTQFYRAFEREYPDCIRTKIRPSESGSNPQWVFQNIDWKQEKNSGTLTH